MKEKKKTYFFEGDVPFDISETKIGFLVKKKLYEGRSPYQKIHVFDLDFYGRTLFLDAILQTSEKDEFVYHEMLCQVPMFLHPAPKSVLIVGGGDGGSLEEVLKHRSVKKVVMVEIDEKVVEVSKKYLPSISKNAFQDKRATLVIGDGRKFIKDHEKEFDVIIFDLSDPKGPAKNLISPLFYKDVKRALKKNGIVSVQSGSFPMQKKLVSLIARRLQKIFYYVVVRGAVVASYQTGLYTFTVASDFPFSKVQKQTLDKRYRKASHMNLRYWSPEVHFASAVLPKYIKDMLKT